MGYGSRLQLIGLIGSGSTATRAPVIVWDKVEHLAKEEQLVVIDDGKRGRRYLGILRGIRRYEPFLDYRRRTSYVDNPDLVDTGTLPHSSCYAEIVGAISDGRLVENDLPPNPGSKVYVVEQPSDLGLELGEGLVVGLHKYSGIEIPLDPVWLPYHVGVVGATGTGKSRLVKALVDEITSKTDYRVIIFDHTGMDYTRYYPGRVVDASRIVLDVGLITDLMLKYTGLYPPTYEPYIIYSILKYIYEYYMSLDEGREIIASIVRESRTGRGQQKLFYSVTDFEEFIGSIDYEKLLEAMAKHPIEWDRGWFRRVAMESVDMLRGRESSKIRLAVAIDLKLGTSFFYTLSGRDMLPRDVVEKAFSDKPVVVDLSSEDISVRRYIVAGIVKELWSIIETTRRPVNTIVVVDEAHNYACRNCGEAYNALSRIAREGRKWGFGLVLATQRIIDIDTNIRGNTNTWFFSRLQTPSDYNELRGYMDLAGISEQSLAILSRREFYLAGLMNPLRIPVLVRVREVE